MVGNVGNNNKVVSALLLPAGELAGLGEDLLFEPHRLEHPRDRRDLGCRRPE